MTATSTLDRQAAAYMLASEYFREGGPELALAFLVAAAHYLQEHAGPRQTYNLLQRQADRAARPLLERGE